MSEQALTHLATSTLEAIAGIVETYCPGEVESGGVRVYGSAEDAVAGTVVPGVLTSISYVDGITGGNVLVMAMAGARRLAAAMIGAEAEGPEDQLSELELSAVSEAMNQMMAAAAAATSQVLGQEIDISPPETRVVTAGAEVLAACAASPHATSAALTIAGAPCRMVQLVPTALVVRMEGALDELAAEYHHPSGGEAPDGGAVQGALTEVLSGVSLRVSAELGRARMAARDVVGLPAGAVVELDRDVQEPIDVYVNGRRFARGSLVVTDDERWAVRIAEICDPTEQVQPEARRTT